MTIIAKVQENVDTLHMIPRTELAFVSGETVKSQVIRANALVNRIVLTLPAFSGATVTATLSIENPDGEEIYSKGSLVEDESHVIITEVPIIGDNTFKITLDTDPLSSGTCYLTVYVRGV
ncbi:hypothetical protein KA005_02870 [bacterium]|nr:hypothetical protein [bacterium]